MAENKYGVIVEEGLHLLEDFYPVVNHRSGCLIDKGISSIENEVTAMHHIGLLKMDDAIPIGVSRSPILNIDGFVTNFLLPTIIISHIWEKLLSSSIISLGG